MAGKDRPSASESFHNSQEALLCPNAASPWWFDVCGTGVILSCLPLLYSASSLPKGPVGAPFPPPPCASPFQVFQCPGRKWVGRTELFFVFNRAVAALGNGLRLSGKGTHTPQLLRVHDTHLIIFLDPFHLTEEGAGESRKLHRYIQGLIWCQHQRLSWHLVRWHLPLVWVSFVFWLLEVEVLALWTWQYKPHLH